MGGRATFPGEPPRLRYPNRNDVAAWLWIVIKDNRDILDESVPWLMDRGGEPESIKSFQKLILTLIITEGGL